MTPDRTTILLMGPTAAGKTDLALELMQHFPAEIVSVDSAMVYRGMDIGTAKPSAELRARWPHHLIDIRDPADSYSVGQFLRDVREVMDGIRARGNMPLFVGGTMLYFHSLINGLAQLPESDPDLRRELDAQAAREGWPALHAELARVDPAAAARIHPNDPQRIQRALEVHALTGVAMSDLQQQRQAVLEKKETISISLCPQDRSVLHERIEKRFQAMMHQGFLEEVQGLRARGDLTPEMPALRAVGYRQLWGHLDGAYDLEEAIRQGIVATRQLAKRQLTWLRSMRQALWFDPADDALLQKVLAAVVGHRHGLEGA